MKIIILKYNAGNSMSVYYALQRLSVEAIITNDPEKIRKCDKLIIPGVGEASSAMNCLKENQLDQLIVLLKQPVLGICLGMQLMCSYSEEGKTECLGIFNDDVKKFDVKDNVKIPQVGWNAISALSSPIMKGIPENAYMYFVHSYFVPINRYSVAQTNYGKIYSSAIQKDNFFGVQFHPEKSSKTGQQLLSNFINL